MSFGATIAILIAFQKVLDIPNKMLLMSAAGTLYVLTLTKINNT